MVRREPPTAAPNYHPSSGVGYTYRYTFRTPPSSPRPGYSLPQWTLALTDLRNLAAWTRALAYLTRETPVRLSVAQLAIFALAALGDRMGTPVTFTQLHDVLDGSPGGAVRTTYGIFFEERRGVRNLGWLWQERCAEDMRIKWLRLTPKGAEVLDAVLLHLGTAVHAA